MWFYTVTSIWARKRRYFYVLFKDDGLFKAVGIRIPESNKKLISYNTVKKFIKLDLINHVTKIPPEKLVYKGDMKKFMYDNAILMFGENIYIYEEHNLSDKVEEEFKNLLLYYMKQFSDGFIC